MILRSQLKKGQYVRIQTELDDSFWYKPLAGRYFQVDEVAKEPDDAKGWGPCYGILICWGMNYGKQMFNDNMVAISDAEQERINYIFKHKEEFKDLFKLGCKIDRVREQIESIIEGDLGQYHFNIWEYESADALVDELEDCIMDEMEPEEIESALEDIKELFDKFLLLLKELTELEEKYVRMGQVTYPKENTKEAV